MSAYMPAEHLRIALLCNASKYVRRSYVCPPAPPGINWYSHILLVPVRAWMMTSTTLHKR
jgi:hypothetical protein